MFKGKYEAKQEFQEGGKGGGIKPKNLPWEGMDISWNNILQSKVSFNTQRASYQVFCPSTQNNRMFITVSLGHKEHLKAQKFEINSKNQNTPNTSCNHTKTVQEKL